MGKFVESKKDIETLGVETADVGVLKSRIGERLYVFFIRIWKQVEMSADSCAVVDVDKTGDGYERKICNVCSKLKKTSEFARNQNAKGDRPVRRPSCQKCRRTMEGVSVSPKERTKWRRTKPHKEPFECPVCRKRTIAGVTCKVVLDHDHRTGKVRGWICDSCNTGLGQLKDDPELIKSAFDYLKG